MAKLFIQTIVATNLKVEPMKTSDQTSTTPPNDDKDENLSDDEVNNNNNFVEKDILTEIASGLHVNQTLYMAAPPTYDFQVAEVRFFRNAYLCRIY